VSSDKKKAIVLKMARPTGLRDLAEALCADQLVPRLKALERSTTSAAAGIEALKAAVARAFAGETCQTGDEVVFTCIGAKTLQVTGTGKTATAGLSSLEDADVCAAFFDAFVGSSLTGPEVVAPALRESMKKRLGLPT
jgi:hypothetical protein